MKSRIVLSIINLYILGTLVLYVFQPLLSKLLLFFGVPIIGITCLVLHQQLFSFESISKAFRVSLISIFVASVTFLLMSLMSTMEWGGTKYIFALVLLSSLVALAFAFIDLLQSFQLHNQFNLGKYFIISIPIWYTVLNFIDFNSQKNNREKVMNELFSHQHQSELINNLNEKCTKVNQKVINDTLNQVYVDMQTFINVMNRLIVEVKRSNNTYWISNPDQVVKRRQIDQVLLKQFNNMYQVMTSKLNLEEPIEQWNKRFMESRAYTAIQELYHLQEKVLLNYLQLYLC